jgi:dUTP pyrophosphatase
MNTENIVKVKLCENAIMPTKGSVGAAGSDLHAFIENTTSINIEPGDRKLISTGIHISMPQSCYARIAPRSGLAVKGIDISAGVVDSDFTGCIKVLVVNNSKEIFTIAHGDRIAQIIFEKIINPVWISTEVLDSTDRGANGFGSTGI